MKVGRMSRAKRILLIASMLLLSVNVLEASLWRRKEPKPAAAPAAALMSLTGVTADGASIVLQTSGAPAYTSYSPSPDVFVVDLTATSRSADLVIPGTLPAGVSAVSAEDVTEMGNRLTRVTVRLTQPLTLQASATGNDVSITVPTVVAEASPVTEPAPAEVAPHVEAIAEAAPAVAADPQPAAETLPAPSSKATVIRAIEASGTGDDVVIRVTGNGALQYKAFRLDNPSRLVVDLAGVKNAASRNAVSVDGSAVRRVRIGQFKTAPEPVTRVVVELNGKPSYDVRNAGGQLTIAFGGAHVESPAIAAALPAAKPAPVPAVVEKPADLTEKIPVVAENAPTWKMPATPASEGARAVIRSGAAQTAPETARPPRTTTPVANEDVFNEAAPSPATGQQLSGGVNPQASRTLSGSSRVFTGEPLSLSLKDADIKGVLRTFAQLTGLNIAVDPQVSGSVTVDFVDVPWDQALDLILRQNGLTFVLEGNVMRVGTVERLAAETTATRRLEEEKRLDVPLTTLSFKLSYARASEVSALLKEIASPRARIITDTRTNQLIISEIPQYLQTMRNMITTVDVPNRQVVIEARIVETTKLFSRQWGFSWGFDGVFDPAFGNGTGLVFPNQVGYTGGPFTFTGGAAPVLGLSLHDVLGTFNLDLALHAAESENLVRVISAPRVTTQDNTAAEIQSGVQIPYQTRVNFTTTVTYIDATLRLSVIPQITEAGTVIMDISLQKTTPGQPIEGAAGTPLNTRQAKTRVMVRDGGTAVIGGIYQNSETQAQSRIPVLHQIPVIGGLFKSHSVNTTHDELLIFITPRIVRG